MRFNFHKYMDYKKCPRRYKMSEDRVKPTRDRNDYFTLFGNLIQKFFEVYANEWKREGLYFTEPLIRSKLQPMWEKVLRYAVVDWNAPFVRQTANEIFEEAILDIMGNLDNLDVYDRTKSEVKIEVTFKSGDVLVGKIDFITDDESGNREDAEILDGKSTNVIGKNIHVEQLYTYAILYKFKYGVYPKKIGILYYRMKEVEYYPMDVEAIESFKKKLIIAMYEIGKLKEFKPTPSAKSCKYCDYMGDCKEGIESANSRKRPRKNHIPVKKTATIINFGFK